MKLKKINALLSLLTVLAAFVHVGYTAYAYLTFYYNPTLKSLTSVPLMVLTCLHMVLAMGIVFFSSDGTKLAQYPRQNFTTILQRASALLILPLLILHLNTFKLLQSCAAAGDRIGFFLALLAQPLFYAAVFTHVAVSLTRALITLGWLSSQKKKRTIDAVFYTVCAIVFAVAVFAVIKGQLAMFLPAGGFR